MSVAIVSVTKLADIYRFAVSVIVRVWGMLPYSENNSLMQKGMVMTVKVMGLTAVVVVAVQCESS
jgi:hypothetical protein